MFHYVSPASGWQWFHPTSEDSQNIVYVPTQINK
jgi:hypothetical protein